MELNNPYFTINIHAHLGVNALGRTSRYSSPRLINQRNQPTKQKRARKVRHAPIWQLAPRIRTRLEMIEKLINRATHVYNWQLARRVRGSPQAAELAKPDVRH
jgi:hypothetical protein